MTESQAETGRTPPTPARAILSYVIPMFGYLSLTTIESFLPATRGGPSPLWYPLAYTAKVVIVACLMWACRSTWRDFSPRPTFGAMVLAVALGLLVIVVWVGLDGYYPMFSVTGTRSAFNPNILPTPAREIFVAVRILGLVLLVPVFEELFWRSFLIRWLVADDFTRVPIGQITPLAAVVSSVMFGLVHPEWLPGVITGLAWTWLLHHTKSLMACVVSHLTANLALAVYVLATGEWKFW